MHENQVPLENQRAFKGVWIPAELWLDERLSMLEKGLAAEIDSLDHPEHHCFASNEYLAKFLQVNMRSLSRMLTNLKALGIIEIVEFNGRCRKLKSNLKTIYNNFETTKEIFYGADSPNPELYTTNLTGQPRQTSSSKLYTTNLTGQTRQKCLGRIPRELIEADNKDYNKEDKKEKEEEEKEGVLASDPPSPPLPPPVSNPSKRKIDRQGLLQVHPGICLNMNQINSLKNKALKGGFTVEEVYEFYADWKLGKQITGGTGDYAAIVNWVIKAVLERKAEHQQVAGMAQKRVLSHQEFIEKLKRYQHLIRLGDLRIGASYVEFPRFHSADYHEIRFTDPAFKEKVVTALRKMNQNVTDL